MMKEKSAEMVFKLAVCLVTIWSGLLTAQTTTSPIEKQTQKQEPTGELAVTSLTSVSDWTQWRGPARTGVINTSAWPENLAPEVLTEAWSAKLSPSYSGPIVVGDRVFVTETKDRKFEVVSALDRQSGKLLWSTSWEGSISVPFFAKSNGDWIRSTPAYDSGRLFVGGMRDVLVCIDAENGQQVWKVDFPATMKSEIPSFGFVCSPMVDGDFVYVQAAGGFCKLKKDDGSLVWRTLVDGGGMMGSAFSSPVIATIAGVRQAVVQTRTKLCGVDLESGEELWSREIPTFRGMNIITPIVHQDHLFVSAYGGTTQYIKVDRDAAGKFSLTQVWNLPVQGYMNSPVVINDHAYLHLRNQRFACFSLKDGKEKWRSQPMGKYASLIANGDKILALNERGQLMLIRANPEAFELIGSTQVGDDSWAHVAIRDQQVFVRNLKELKMLDWKEAAPKPSLD